jgi:tetratricopeptide (TPR) repeat protein
MVLLYALDISYSNPILKKYNYMDSDLAHKAITLALSGNWQEALTVNLAILKLEPRDIDAMNRLARVYGELGEVEKAKKYSLGVLKIDPTNSIAGKALNKWQEMKPGKTSSPAFSSSAEAFLEDPGKTKIVPLLHLGCQEVLSELDSGDKIKLDCHCHRVAATTTNGKYIGRLPDDLSARIKKLVALKNEYEALVKSIDPHNQVKIFIRETVRGKKAAKIISFPGEKIEYTSNLILPDELFS